MKDIFFASTGYTICSLIEMIMVFIIYFRKRKDGTKVRPLFMILMASTLIPLCSELLSLLAFCFLPETFEYKRIIYTTLDRSVLVMSLFWIFIFAVYVFTVVREDVFGHKEKDSKKQKNIRLITYTVCLLIAILISIFIPYSWVIASNNGARVLTGTIPAIINFTFLMSTTFLIVNLILYRNRYKKTYITPFIFVFLLYIALLVLGVRFSFYTNNLASFFGFIITILFFTVESQDAQILENYNKSKELKKARENAKDKILINMSHEVRSPMFNIIGCSELIKEGNLTDEEIKSNLEIINSSNIELNDIINNLKDITNMDKEVQKANQTEYDTKSLYINIYNYAKRRNKNNLNINFEVEETSPSTLYADASRIYKILTKILDNVITNTNSGEVKMTITHQVLSSEYVEFTYEISSLMNSLNIETYNMNYEEYISKKEDIDYIKIGAILAKKYVDILGGTIDFVQNDEGSKYIITIRQKIINSTQIGKLFQN